jgi:hypothetical protein
MAFMKGPQIPSQAARLIATLLGTLALLVPDSRAQDSSISPGAAKLADPVWLLFVRTQYAVPAI